MAPIEGGGAQSTAKSAAADPEISIRLNGVSIKDALGQIFAAAGRPYQLDAENVSGTVNISLQQQPLSRVLKIVFGAASPKLGFRMDGNVFVIDRDGVTPPRPELVLQSGHTLPPFSLVFTPDSRYVASGGYDRTARLWDTVTGREVRMMAGDRTNVLTSLAISPDGKTLAAACWDSNIHRWNLKNGIELPQLQGHSHYALAVAFSPDGKLIASGAADRTVRIWDANTGGFLRSVNDLPKFPTALAFSPDSRKLAIATGVDIPGLDHSAGIAQKLVVDDGHFPVLIIDPTNGNQVAELAGHPTSIQSVAWDRSGAKLITTGSGGIVVAWDAALHKRLRAYTGTRELVNATFAADDSAVVLCGPKDGFLHVDLRTGRKLFDIPDSGGNTFAVSPNGRYAAFAQGSNVSIVDIAHRTVLHTEKSKAAAIRHVKFASDSTHVFSWSDTGGRVFDLKTGKAAFDLTMPIEGDVYFPIDDGHSVLYFKKPARKGARGSLSRFDFATGDDRFLFGLSGDEILFRKDGKRVFTADENGLRCIDCGTHKTIWERTDSGLERAPSGAFPFAIDVSGSRVAVYDSKQKKLCLLDGETGATTSSYLNIQKVTHMVFSPEGKRLAISVWGNLTYFNVNGKMVPRGERGPSVYVNDLTGGKNYRWNDFTYVDDLAFRQDGNVLVVAGGTQVAVDFHDQERRLAFYDTVSGAVLRNQKMPDSVTSIDFSQDGKWMATAGFEKSVRFWDAATLGGSVDEKVTLYPFYPSGYLWATPSLSYMASKDALPNLAFRVGEGMFSFEQFDLLLNRPDVVLNALGYAPRSLIEQYHDLWLRRLHTMKIDPEKLLRQYHLPEVTVPDSDLKASVATTDFSFTAQASDTQYKLDRLQVTVNNVPVYGRAGLSLADKQTQKADVPITIQLSRGRNVVTVSALNERGAESLRDAFEVYSNPPASALPTLWVAAVGVSNYADPAWPHLPYAAKDAKDFTAFFKNKPTKRFGAVQVLPLTDGDATHDAVIAKLTAFIANARPDDTFILLLAGHGTLGKGGTYYFGAQDISFSDPEKGVSSALGGLSYDEIQDLLFAVHARQKLLLMDTCQSGEIEDTTQIAGLSAGTGTSSAAAASAATSSATPALPVPTTPPSQIPAPVPPATVSATASAIPEAGVAVTLRSPGGIVRRRGESLDLMQEMFADLRQGSGANVISAAGGYESAQERSDLKNGVFTFAVMEALADPSLADTNGDGVLLVSELRDYVIHRVLELTRQGQKPTSRAENLELDFPVNL